MHHKKALQKLELTDSIIGTSDGLSALFASDTHPNMRLHYHADIISSITDRKSDPLPLGLG
jgi:hypothetical protein